MTQDEINAIVDNCTVIVLGEHTFDEVGLDVSKALLYENDCSPQGRYDEVVGRASRALILEDLARIDVARSGL
jgi:hypothetical protein